MMSASAQPDDKQRTIIMGRPCMEGGVPGLVAAEIGTARTRDPSRKTQRSPDVLAAAPFSY